jgi:hypothetical protein
MQTARSTRVVFLFFRLQVLHMFRAQRKQYYLFEHVLQQQHQYGGQTS